MQLLVRWMVLALGVMLATKIVPGISCDDGATLIVVVLLLSFFNAILKPVLVLFTLPFIIVTMGLGVLVINALLFLFVGRLVEGFQVSGFWSAFLGSVVVSVTNMLLSSFTRRKKVEEPRAAAAPAPAREPKKVEKTDDVIDI